MVSNAELAYLTEQALILANFVELAERIVGGADEAV
jgi:hypothetical protein